MAYKIDSLSLQMQSRWRTCFWIAVIPAIMLAIGMEWCAESPRWLFKVPNYTAQ